MVERVARLAAEKVFMSSSEKDCTLANSRRRSVLPRDAPMRAATVEERTARIRLRRAAETILMPFPVTAEFEVSPDTTCSWMASVMSFM